MTSMAFLSRQSAPLQHALWRCGLKSAILGVASSNLNYAPQRVKRPGLGLGALAPTRTFPTGSKFFMLSLPRHCATLNVPLIQQKRHPEFIQASENTDFSFAYLQRIS
jgi:hypothetical protein